jgi:hypothetical protein
VTKRTPAVCNPPSNKRYRIAPSVHFFPQPPLLLSALLPFHLHGLDQYALFRRTGYAEHCRDLGLEAKKGDIRVQRETGGGSIQQLLRG